MYNEVGLEEYCKTRYKGNTSDLDTHTSCSITYFEQNPPQSIKQAAGEIERLVGIKRSETQVRNWLKKKGFRFRKIGHITAKANLEAQKTFVENTVEPLIKRAKAKEIHLLYLDGAHFVMGAFLCCVWSLTRKFVKSSSGRKRYNVLGVIDAMSKKIHVWTNDSYLNANSIVDFLHQLRIYYFDMKPI